MQTFNHDLIIMGTGLAGLRAATEAASLSKGKLDIAMIAKTQLMRSHSVCAEGGTAAALRPEEGDSPELHAWDTVKGSDFLADQDVVRRFVEDCPKEIMQMNHWGVPWSRKDNGRINQRPFGGHSFPRAVFAVDKTGFFEMQTLYDTMQKHAGVKRYDEWFVTSMLIEDNTYKGFTAVNLCTGEYAVFRGKALIIATGGACRIYGFTTYSFTVTGDGMAMAYRAGIPLKDMEFVQFHPTGLVPSGILMTEACRGEGGYLKNSNGDRFMKDYAAGMMEVAPRDIVARAEMVEIEAGRGFTREDGLDYVHLDLTHLGADKINTRLPLIREVCINFLGLDPINEPIPIRPAAHYSMGGIDCDINGATKVEGIWVAGEAACISLHGANRLGSNSTAECLVWGAITGKEASEYAMKEKLLPDIPEQMVKEEENRLFKDFLQRDGDENLYTIRRDLRDLMDKYTGVFRTGDDLQKGLNEVHELMERFKRIKITDKSAVYNTDLLSALELQNMLDISEIIVLGALERKESRGGHSRRDYPDRDDDNFLKHTLAYYENGKPRLDYSPVVTDTWKPVERKY